MINTRSIEKLNILFGPIQFLMTQNSLEEEKQCERMSKWQKQLQLIRQELGLKL